MTLFDWLEQITVKKQPFSSFGEEDWNSFNTFLIHKYLSMNVDYIELVNYIQKIPYDQKHQIYTVYCELIPKRKVWLKWIGGKKTKSKVDLIPLVTKHYECGINEAKDYIELLGKGGLTELLTSLGKDPKEIKTLIK
jgi:hypothetical protein